MSQKCSSQGFASDPLKTVSLVLGDRFAYTGPDRNWESRGAAEKWVGQEQLVWREQPAY